MEKPRVIPCPDNQEGCKYADTPLGCHESTHHIFPRRTAETRLQRDYSNLPRYKIIACRMIHDLLDTFPPPAFPAPERMKRQIEESRE